MPHQNSPGFRFKGGKLYRFTEDSVMILESWPVLRALRKINDGPWEEFTPTFRVVRPYRPRTVAPSAPSLQLELGLDVTPRPRPDNSIAGQRRRAFDGFRFSLPKPVATRAEKFQSRQWALLRLFRAREQTIELAAANAALCFALGNHSCFCRAHLGRSLKNAVKVSEMRQREIAGWLGFPPSDGAARILAKLAPESASVELLMPLRDALKDAEVGKALAHLPSLNAGVLAIVLGARLFASSTPKLLAEVAAIPTEKYRQSIADLLEDTLRMLRRVHPNRGTPKFQSIARLREVHDEVSVEYLRCETAAIEALRFPRPPIPGTLEILPLCTPEDLIEEGRAQNNCVATYAERVRRKSVFIYRVLKPERATLSIEQGSDGDWQIGELKCRSNQQVSANTHRMVEAWLSQYALSA